MANPGGGLNQGAFGAAAPAAVQRPGPVTASLVDCNPSVIDGCDSRVFTSCPSQACTQPVTLLCTQIAQACPTQFVQPCPTACGPDCQTQQQQCTQFQCVAGQTIGPHCIVTNAANCA